MTKRNKHPFFKTFNGCSKVGSPERPSNAAMFTTYRDGKKTYNLTALVNLLSNPPKRFTPEDRKMASDALENVAMRNFGLNNLC